jgi:hypothetical protein
METKDILQTIQVLISIMASCCSTFIWQIILVGFIFQFRNQITALLSRVAVIKLGGSEVGFQTSESGSIKPGGEADKQMKLLGTSGFYTKEGLTELINNSGLVGKDEKVVSHLLLFQTEIQHTWLIATPKNLFCILDDENTQSTEKLIQWKLALNDTNPISAQAHKRTIGLVSIGGRRNWLYSRRLHPRESELVSEISSMIEKAGTRTEGSLRL